MIELEIKRLIHEAEQQYIKDGSTSLRNHLERTQALPLTKQFVDSMLLSLKDKNDLVTELYKEIERLKAVAK